LIYISQKRGMFLAHRRRKKNLKLIVTFVVLESIFLESNCFGVKFFFESKNVSSQLSALQKKTIRGRRENVFYQTQITRGFGEWEIY